MIKIVFIGAGNMAQEHAKVFRTFADVELAGVYSRTTGNAQKFAQAYGITHVCASISDLYQKTQADLAIICVPELAANTVIKQALQHNWALFLEKPVGYDLADANDIFDATAGHRPPIMVGLNRRFYDSTLRLQSELCAQDQNEVRFVHICDQQSYQEARQFNHPEQVVEKFMYANSIHLIDLIMFFCRGEIEKIVPVEPWQKEKSQIMLSYIHFSSGDRAYYQGIWKGPGRWGCRVYTKPRHWIMEPLENLAYINQNERKVNLHEMDSIDTEFKPGLYRQAEMVLPCLKNEKSTIATLADSMATMKLIHGMFGV